ncbi:MAG: hypothetical protein PPFGHCPK_01049 [Spiroplasma endosymbiont of Drosophila atripex]|nr:MAG: hypothetical protein PPFGHCPK_01049 [Spiroplasma endosymbiont of Drosophila atripex]
MSKIFLCGNGINIKFNKKYALNEFVDLLMHDEMLKNFVQNYNFRYDISLDNNDYFEREKNLNEFLKIIKKFKFEILEAKNKLSKNGVEAVIKDLFNSIELLLAFIQENEKIYSNFEKYFKILFFSYIWNLGNEHTGKWFCKSNFKKMLSAYMQIITLNYDNNLEKLLTEKETDIIHWHGNILQNPNGTLNFSDCLLDTIRNPKSSESFIQIPLFTNYQKYKSKFELDIVGLNPANDENIFALFINSQICNKINFFWHHESDLQNLKLVLNKIKNFQLEIDKNNKIILKKTHYEIFNIKYEEECIILKFKKYTKNTWGNDNGNESYTVTDDGNVIINLIHSSLFWNDTMENPNDYWFTKISNYQQ